jgi:stage V sporulation protein G
MANTDTNTDIKLDVRVYPIENPKGATVAFASATVGEVLAVNNIKLINSDKGLFVAMPNVKDNRGDFRDICHPVTAGFREKLNNAILSEYSVACEKAASEKESTIEKLREAGREAKKNLAPAKPAVGKSGPEL